MVRWLRCLRLAARLEASLLADAEFGASRHRATCRQLATTAAATTTTNPAPAEPQQTSLYDFHVKHGGKMVPFAGFLLPVSYGSEGVAASHLHTRAACSVFDVSHMMQTEVRGKDRVAFLERLCPADLQGLADNASTLTAFTHPITGGIMDDLIVTKTALGYLYLVSNAARRTQDQKILLTAQADFLADGKDVSVRFIDPPEQSLLAVQGPLTVNALQPLLDVDLSQLSFMESTLATVCGVPRCRVTRCGYTGEDGVEISLAADRTTEVVERLLASDVVPVKLAGLGARDSLRLEAGLCLHGNDIDASTTPVEAGMSWIVAKRRRSTGGFPGARVILDQLKTGPLRRRVGLRSTGPPARAGAGIVTPTGDAVGTVTSGCPSPTLGGNIAMGYVPTELSKVGTALGLQVRDKIVPATVTKMPFVPTKYFVRRKE